MNPALRCLSLALTAAAVGLAVTTSGADAPAISHGTNVIAPGNPIAQIVSATPVGGRTGGPAARTAARTATGTGYVLADSRLIGITPKGLTVSVDRGVTNHGYIAQQAKAVVVLWRKWGINATYAGYGKPAAAEGVVQVTEGPAGCQGAEGRVGNTWQYWMPLTGTKQLYVYRARIVLCPKLWSYQKWQWQATIRHELGHAAGLGHFNGTYTGTTQVMRAVNHAPVDTYQAGDIRGLKFLAAHNDYVKRDIPVTGQFEKSTYADGAVTLTGWALLDYYKDQPVTIQVTDNGTMRATALTNLLRADVNKTHDPSSTRRHGFAIAVPYTGGSHEYCATAISSVNPANKVNLGCADWR